METSPDVGKAEQMLQLHSDSVLHMQNCVFEVLQMGQELAQVRNCPHKTVVISAIFMLCILVLLQLYSFTLKLEL